MQTAAYRVAYVGALSALSTAAMLAVRFPILPGAAFMKYDPSNAVALAGALTLGPAPGVVIVATKDILFWLVRDGNPLGPLANFLASATFVGIAAAVARAGRKGVAGAGPRGFAPAAWRPYVPEPGPARMLAAVAAGTLARVAVMAAANFPILHLQFGMPASRTAALLWPAIVPFNAAESLINGALAAALALVLSPRHAMGRPAAKSRPSARPS